jgi:hypothetical protein
MISSHSIVQASYVERSTLGFNSNIQLSHFKRLVWSKSQNSHFQRSLTILIKPINHLKAQLTLYNNRGITLNHPCIFKREKGVARGLTLEVGDGLQATLWVG